LHRQTVPNSPSRRYSKKQNKRPAAGVAVAAAAHWYPREPIVKDSVSGSSGFGIQYLFFEAS
jgi:hypothetical protein